MTDTKRPSLLARVFGPRSAAEIVEKPHLHREAEQARIVAAAVDAAVSRFAFSDDERRQIMGLLAETDRPLSEQVDILAAWIRLRLPEWMDAR